MSHRTLRWIAVVGFCVLAVPGTARSDEVLMAGGAHLTEARTTFASNKIIPGGDNTDLIYRFTFKSEFDVAGVTIQMEEEDGGPITAAPDRGITRVLVRTGPGSPPRETSVTIPSATAAHAWKSDILAGQTFTVDVTARATASAVRFSLAFSTRTAGESVPCTRLAEVEAGPCVCARSFPESTTGLSLRMTNKTKGDLRFARFSLLGDTVGIASVRVVGASLAVTMDGKRAFTLTGDDFEAGTSVQLLVFFDDAASGPGALLARFAGF